MIVAFDTSVLVAGSIATHPHCLRAQAWLDAAHEGTIQPIASTHTFAELYATLTALPIEPRIPPPTAWRIVERATRTIRPVELGWDGYRAALERCTDRDVRSGGVYDAIHFLCAEVHHADVMLTFNTAHFTRLATSTSPRVVAPPDPPGLIL